MKTELERRPTAEAETNISLGGTVVRPEIIRIKGRNTNVPSVQIDGRNVIAVGRFLKTARLFDEELVEGEPVGHPDSFIEKLKQSTLAADILTFAQRPPDQTPKYHGYFEWDNWAMAPTTDFKAWWEGLPQESRKNVRRAAKKGVSVRVVIFDDELVRGIQGIYNETPVRQGKRFWHFGKDFETVKMENATYLGRSEFVGAFFANKLIGFIKMIYVDHRAMLIQILAMNEHHDKRPMNALLAHTMEVCERKGIQSLVYGNYVYGKRNDSSLTEFKRRNGFKQVNFPRYYVPLTTKGKAAIRMNLHLGVSNIMPKPIGDLLLGARAVLAKNWARITAR
ncbi:MAG: hypothetical protein H0U23_13795 [Blastocatellia bacterium]|nr:hypothetical protein [Blastocatellia bacterium]